MSLSRLSGFTASVIYYGYMSAASLALALITGAIGFIAAHWFVRAVLRAIRNVQPVTCSL